METFRIQNLSFAYPGPSGPALEKVCLDVAEGSFLVLCGQSGCGKTTLLRQLKPSMAPPGRGRFYFGAVRWKTWGGGRRARPSAL